MARHVGYATKHTPQPDRCSQKHSPALVPIWLLVHQGYLSSTGILSDPDKRRRYDVGGFDSLDTTEREIHVDLSSLGVVSTAVAALFTKLGKISPGMHCNPQAQCRRTIQLMLTRVFAGPTAPQLLVAWHAIMWLLSCTECKMPGFVATSKKVTQYVYGVIQLAARVIFRRDASMCVQPAHLVCMAAGVPVKTVVADNVWQALATGNFNALALAFGQKLSDKVDCACESSMFF